MYIGAMTGKIYKEYRSDIFECLHYVDDNISDNELKELQAYFSKICCECQNAQFINTPENGTSFCWMMINREEGCVNGRTFLTSM